MEKRNICLNLLVDRKAHKVLCAECGKDFIDLLFNILTLPIAYFFGQPNTKFVFGCLGNMFPIMNNSGANHHMEPHQLQEIMAWIITDNLFIAPSSAASVNSAFKKYNSQVDQLRYKTIEFHMSDLETEFLQVSVKSKTVLTQLFLRQTGWRKSKNGKKSSVTLIVDTKANRVISAEAGKDLFCFLMSILQLPIATFINRTKTNRVGSIGNVYQSVKNMNEAYMQSNQTKDELLTPSPSKWFEALQLFHARRVSEATPNNKLSDSDGGYVKELIVYMVTDDLSVTPFSFISSMARYNMFSKAESTAKLEIKTVEFGVNEVVRFLEASFRSETVLSDIFLARDELDDVVVA